MIGVLAVIGMVCAVGPAGVFCVNLGGIGNQ